MACSGFFEPTRSCLHRIATDHLRASAVELSFDEDDPNRPSRTGPERPSSQAASLRVSASVSAEDGRRMVRVKSRSGELANLMSVDRLSAQDDRPECDCNGGTHASRAERKLTAVNSSTDDLLPRGPSAARAHGFHRSPGRDTFTGRIDVRFGRFLHDSLGRRCR